MRTLAVAAILALAGCSALMPDRPPESINEKAPVETNLATGYLLLSEVRLFAAEAVRNKTLNVEEGKKMLSLTDTARSTLDAARDAHFAGKPGATIKAMEIVQVIVNQVRQEVQDKINAKAKGGK